MRRLNILYLPEPTTDPYWRDDLLVRLGDRHAFAEVDFEEPLAPQFKGIDVVVDMGGSVGTREMMDAATDAKLWVVVGTGLDHVDVEYMKGRGFVVTYCPGPMSAVALAECAMMFMGMLVREYKRSEEVFRRRLRYFPTVGDLEGMRLLILGFGASGRALARRAKAFDMKVWGIDINPVEPEVLGELQPDFIGTPDDLDRLLGECDFLSLHLHLHEGTENIIDARRIGLMKPSAYIINVARGKLVDNEALYAALLAGRLAGAGLDVFANEPEDPEHPVFQLPNVVVSPHIAGETRGTARKRNAAVLDNIDRLATGRELLYRVDVERPR